MAGKGANFVGVDLGGTKIYSLLLAADGEIRGTHKVPTLTDGTPLAEQISGAVDGLLKARGVPLEEVHGIGVAVPGVVDSRTGRFVTAPNLEIDDPDLIGRLRERFALPVFIGNDVNLGTLAEVFHGAGKGAESAVGVFVGTGIGGGVVLGGRLWAGSDDLAGEIGHLVLQVDGPECGCGNLGCFEALASRTALERDIRRELEAGRESVIAEAAADERIKSGALARALEAEDELVVGLCRRVAHYLAQGILTIRHCLDPDVIILGGGVVEACSDFLLPLIDKEVRADNLKGSRDSLAIVVSSLGDDAVALGAADLARLEVADLAPPPRKPSRPEVRYPLIESALFGGVRIDGKEYSHDICIRADGKVRKRKKEPARKRHGTSHVIDSKELARLCKGDPRTVLISEGFSGMVRLTEDATAYLESTGAVWRLVRSDEIPSAYNSVVGTKALLLHVTC